MLGQGRQTHLPLYRHAGSKSMEERLLAVALDVEAERIARDWERQWLDSDYRFLRLLSARERGVLMEEAIRRLLATEGLFVERRQDHIDCHVDDRPLEIKVAMLTRYNKGGRDLFLFGSIRRRDCDDLYLFCGITPTAVYMWGATKELIDQGVEEGHSRGESGWNKGGSSDLLSLQVYHGDEPMCLLGDGTVKGAVEWLRKEVRF